MTPVTPRPAHRSHLARKINNPGQEFREVTQPRESTMQVNVLEAKNRLSELLRSAVRGEEVVIANRGRGVAKLVRLDSEAATALAEPGHAATFVAWLEQHSRPEGATKLSDAQRHAEIQARIEAQRSAWE
jgi:prevent-host-death family protein